MRRLKYLSVIALVAGMIISCKKSNDLIPAASLNVVNASPGIANAKVRTPNVPALYYNQMKGVDYANSQVFILPVGSPQITINSSTDTLSKPLYSSALGANAGDIYSLFIGGAAGGDIVINKDAIPYRPDSSIGVRFINMSYNSTPVNVMLSTSSTANEFSNVAYKSVTDFKTYSATSVNPASYTFQARDGNGNLLASVDVSRTTYIWHNVTLVLSGQMGGTGTDAPKLFIVKNY